MKSILSRSVLPMLLVSIAASTSHAEEMSTGEILERFRMQQENAGTQQSGGATRGLTLSYGDESDTASAPEVTTPGIALAPTAPTAPTEPTAPLGSQATEPLTPQATVPILQQVYVPVQEEARVDLRIYFEWNSASLKPEAIGQLSSLCAAIQQVVASQAFRIIGHTDKSGTDEYNLYLSQARAREVKRHLVEECAIPRDSLLATGEGERQADPNAPQRNPDERRVEVQLVS